MEVLQLACLEPDLAILDEIDSGACSRVRSQQHMTHRRSGWSCVC